MSDFHEGDPPAIRLHDARMARAAHIFEDALPVVLGYKIVSNGEMNTVLVQPVTEGFVIKAPDELAGYDTHTMLDREVAVTELVNEGLEENGLKLTVGIPHFLSASGDESGHHWAAFSAVGGTVLDRNDILNNFSTAEYQDLGRKLGSFTVGLSQAVDVDTFRNQISCYDRVIIDREAQLKATLGELSMFEELGYTNLVKLLTRLGKEYHDLRPEREQATPIVIHDDLHPGNWAFTSTEKGHWELSEVFDFAITKVGTAARNFRHVASLHPEALQAAVETWNAATGEVLSERLITFWTSLHYAISCTNGVRDFGAVSAYATQVMQQIHPEVDWQTEFSRATRIKGRPAKE